MLPVLYLSRHLSFRPITPPSDLVLRPWQGNADIDPWLALHRAAFPAQRQEKRQWVEADLRRELLSRPLWRADWTWFAQPNDAPHPVGMISLLARANDPPERVHIHWLAVDPEWRRRGIARQLLVTAEQAAWDAGYPELTLETLASWREAVAFYAACGYQSSR